MPTRSTMVALDTGHSGLAEAVASMSMRSSSSTTLISSCSERMTGRSGGLDSGYASQSSTPDSLKEAFVGGSVKWPQPLRKPKKLMPYAKPIPRLTRERFLDLRELYAESLNQLTRGLPNCRGVLMSLQVLGENEASAEPWVFVQCDKAVFKRVSNFFKQPHVKTDFESPDPSDRSPRLRVIVCPLKPRQLTNCLDPSSEHNPSAQSESIQIFSDRDKVFNTLCGIQVTNGRAQGLHGATVGGVIMITGQHGDIKLYAMTAGHFLLQESCEENLDELGYELEHDLYTEEEEYIIDLSSFNADIEEEEIPPRRIEDNRGDKANPTKSSRIGELSMASYTCLQDGRNLDWALIAIDNQFVNFPNTASRFRQVHHFGVCKFDNPKKEVMMASARGLIWGTLAETWSYIMLPPGKTLIRTYLLTLSKRESFQYGDSGAWIIDAYTNKLYGHVVASDVFGRGYVVPICDSFKDIKNRQRAESVSLPPMIDFSQYDTLDASSPIEPVFSNYVDSGYSTMNSSVDPSPQSTPTLNDKNTIG